MSSNLSSLQQSKQSHTMSGFPKLTPAFTVRVTIDAPMPVGGQAGSSLVIVPMVGGNIKSEDGVEPKLDAELYVAFLEVLGVEGGGVVR